MTGAVLNYWDRVANLLQLLKLLYNHFWFLAT